MSAIWPSVAEERAMTLGDRIDEWRKDGLITAGEAQAADAAAAVPWRSHGLVASIVFFVLTSLAVGFTYFLFDLLKIPGGFVTLIAIATAEALIIGQRWFGTGVESALWIGGLLAFIFSLPSSGKPEALLVFTAAFLIAGIRVRNPLFITIAAIFVIAYFAARQWPTAALVSGVAAGTIALVVSSREWRRPSTEMLWDALLVLMPVAGLVAYAVALQGTMRPAVALIFASLAIAALRVGLVTRDHAPLVGAFVDSCAVYAILQANDLVPGKVETQAIVAGLVILGAAAAMQRFLRGRTRGITATPVRMSELEELTQLAGAVHVQHTHEPAPAEPQPVSGGGSFGGAGASGDY